MSIINQRHHVDILSVNTGFHADLSELTDKPEHHIL